MKEFDIVLLGKKTLNSFVHFLEESSAWKIRYDFVWPLERKEEVKIRILMDFISKIVFTLKQKPARQSQAACLLPGGLEGKSTLEIEKKKMEKQKKN